MRSQNESIQQNSDKTQLHSLQESQQTPVVVAPQFNLQTGNPKQMSTNAVTKFAFATKTGMAPSNPNKQNQDNWITVPHFCGLKYCHFFSVCDGHGQWGREVSTYLKQKLPQYLESEFKYVI